MQFCYDNFKRRPSGFVTPTTYFTITSYLLGVDAALHSGLLIGYHEWLVPRVGAYENVRWPQLTLVLAFPEVKVPSICEHKLRNPDNEKHAIDSLFKCLDAFFAERSMDNGLRHIFQRYQLWLSAQEWYEKGWPDYYVPEENWWKRAPKVTASPPDLEKMP